MINLAKHKLDFADAVEVFAGQTVTAVDDRFDYLETRYVTLGLLDGRPVAIVHTESSHEIRIIPFRRASAREADVYYRALGLQDG